ncbi:MAG: hypothetical protein KAG61_08505 [Bacteriovoracaceae bacterium]|nr:hypothetical protein [Bacteriovoracaceae bacterium]
MVNIFFKVLSVFCLVVTAAHFYRHGYYIFSVISIMFPILLFFKNKYGEIIYRFGLFLAGAEWIRTIFILISRRVELDRPWGRMTAILFTVAILHFTVAGILSKKKNS